MSTSKSDKRLATWVISNRDKHCLAYAQAEHLRNVWIRWQGRVMPLIVFVKTGEQAIHILC